MKKSAFFCFAFVIFSFFLAVRVHAQAFEAGTNVVSVGLGLGSSIADYTYGTQTPGISASYERGIWEAGPGVISLGGLIGYKGYRYAVFDNNNSYVDKWNYTILGVRGAYHYTGLSVPNLDLYGGVMLSYDNLSYSTTYNGPNAPSFGTSSVELSLFVGGRYYFAGNLGGFAELGYGVAILNLGLSYKF
jgi:hypothetical protein